MARRRPNILLIAVDSLRRDHLSSYGYRYLTSPHIDRFATSGTLFENHFSPSIPTTSAYASMLTGMDCFGTDVVALRHQGGLGQHLTTMAELLGTEGYNTTCVGFTGNPSSRGFQKYLDYEGWHADATGRCPKAENLNAVTIPEMRRLAREDHPFFLFLRHMDPHAPYLPPKPFERAFYGGDPFDPQKHSLDGVYGFKPFCDFHKSWIPEGCTDSAYVDAQYDGAIGYMDASIQALLNELSSLGLDEDTIVVFTADHGESLLEHDCNYDHHGLYECTLVVPLIIRFPGRVPAGRRIRDMTLISDVMPTVCGLAGIRTASLKLFGRNLAALWEGKPFAPVSEFYLTEATWMRKHGWRTPEWKLIHALEPDFHFKPEVELYNLVEDPQELHNLASQEPAVVALLEERMQHWIQQRERATGRANPVFTNVNWHGHGGGPFQSSQQAYDTLHIGGIRQAQVLQAKK